MISICSRSLFGHCLVVSNRTLMATNQFITNHHSNNKILDWDSDNSDMRSFSTTVSSKNKVSLEDYLKLKQVSNDTYTNASELFIPYRGRGLFGGTLAAQSTLASLLHANSSNISTGKRWKPISNHCSFLQAAKPSPELIYQVLDLKGGKNYCTKEIRLFQNDNLIFKSVVTLQSYILEGSAGKNLEGQLNHHRKAPVIGVDIDPPEKMLDQDDLFRIWAQKSKTHKHLEYLKDVGDEVIKSYSREPCLWKLPLNMFDLDEVSEAEKQQRTDERTLRYWVKTKTDLIDPDVFSWVALAYISDYFYLSTNMRLNMREMFTTKFSVSLDHTIYFNQQIDPSNWFNYNVKNLKAGENRSIMFGEMFDQNGVLAATTVQEGLSVIYTDD